MNNVANHRPRAQTPGSPVPLPPPPRYPSAAGWLRRALFGRALPTSHAAHEKLPKWLALPIFSSDALSSNAYATEAILGVLTLKGSGALVLSWPVALAIALLLAVVVVSYRQIIFAYPEGGGAYPVSRDNLGVLPALIAGASLLVDYVLTVAVSVAAGVAAVITAVPGLHTEIVPLCLLSTLILTLANLRGVRETGAIFALPTYAFIVSLIATIIAGFIALALHAPHVAASVAHGHAIEGAGLGMGAVGLYLILQAFSSGCTALTGVEAISNTTPLFRQPQARNAASTMTWMGILSTIMFLGLTYLAKAFGIQPISQSDPGYQSVVGMVAALSWPAAFHWMFFVVQASTAAVLVLAANTAFAGFPQLASMMARDNFLPRQLANLGDRLAFSNGIVVLACFASLLLILFHGIVDDLLPLYAIGVFTSFTLAQSGMVLRWLRQRGPGWKTGLLFNGMGAVVTGAVAVIIAVSKFAEGAVISPRLHLGRFTPHYGAWLVVVLIPLLVMVFLKINRHYADMIRELSLAGHVRTQPKRNTVLVLVPRLHRGVVDALDYAAMVSEDVRAIYIETNPESTSGLKREWEYWAGEIPLVIIESQYRSLLGPLLRYVEAVQAEAGDEVITIIVPELVTRKWWHRLLHNQAGTLIRFALAHRRDVVVTNVRYFLEY